MRISYTRSALILLLATLTGACANDKGEQVQEIAQLRMEIEQLTNALGRLEFRVYELENQQGAAEAPGESADGRATGTTDKNAPATGALSDTESAPEESGKRFDLAPVE